jgi:uncharacterized damage-inducible protein DinB
LDTNFYKNMTKVYRKGAVGALMDEYERASLELRNLVKNIDEETYLKIFDSETKDEDCRSIQTIMSHVVRASYGYANSIREVFPIDSQVYQPRLLAKNEVLEKFDEVIQYTVETLEGRWEMTYEEIFSVLMKSSYPMKSDSVDDLEQKLEHAIVHILRHRRQIEKFLANS